MTIQSLFDSIIKNKRIIAFLVAASVLLCTAALNFVHSTTAKVIIKFVGEDAAEGLTEKGTEIDPYEMSSALIIKNAAQNLGYNNINTEPIRRNMTITPITSTAEKEKYASWIENFSDYGENEDEMESPVYYSVTYRTSEGDDYARNMLYSIVKSYRDYYTKKYTYQYDITNLDSDINSQYDYYEIIELLGNKIDSNIDYLNNMIESDFDYRSYKLGYSLQDLIDQYKQLEETDLAIAEQTILDNTLSKNYSVLISSLKQKSVTAEQNAQLNGQYSQSVQELMNKYSEKNSEYMWDRFGEDEQSNQVREDVERDDVYAQYQSTYDRLITDYTEYRTEQENQLIDKKHYDEVIADFENGAKKDIQNDEIEQELSIICDSFHNISDITKQVVDEYNIYRESKSVLAVSGVIVESSANTIFYYTLSILMALSIGILFSIFKELYKAHSCKHNQTLQETVQT